MASTVLSHGIGHRVVTGTRLLNSIVSKNAVANRHALARVSDRDSGVGVAVQVGRYASGR